ncbi:MAG TPA: nitroreductase/quinone reductase family protein [Ktedonobacterales bacterium]|nr:nitroreductase/quinone reductase family protein [Ktedonobacterales bacterium]
MALKPMKMNYFWVAVYNLTGGRLPQNGADDPVGILKLTTTGRKSGQPREVSLIYIKHGSDFAVAASNGGQDKHPGWYFNLRSNPHVKVRIKGWQTNALAEVAGPQLRQQLWEQLVAAASMYAGYERRTRREIPMILLRPEEA